jgi:hypothetical protein
MNIIKTLLTSCKQGYNINIRMTRKYPSELNTKHIRVSLGDYAMLKEISMNSGVTMAEALHMAVERQVQVARVSPAQIPMVAIRLAPDQ